MTSLMHPTPTRVAVTGANGHYAWTLLSQLRSLKNIHPTVLVDSEQHGLHDVIRDLDISNAVVAADINGIDWNLVDVLVEATGNLHAGISYAVAAIDHGVNVVMVSKEVESVAGIALWHRANAAGVRYLLGDGDQPANAIRLVTWLEWLGLDVVAFGKSSEYDLVFDPVSETVTQLGTTISTPQLPYLLDLDKDVQATLNARAEAVSALRRHEAADYCEMAIVAQYLTATPDSETLHYPVARPAELADIYALQEHSGITKRDRFVDVFSALRLPGEASYAGGVFAVVRTNDQKTWHMLSDKGHIVSRDGRYACIGWPYHLMGVETPLTIDNARSKNIISAAPNRHVDLSGRAEHELVAGTELHVHGHHHEIDGVRPVIRTTLNDNAVPFYLLDGTRLRHNVPPGHLLGFNDVAGVNAQAKELFQQQF